LTECQLRITKALDAIYIYNPASSGPGSMGPMIFGNVVPGPVNAPAIQTTEATPVVTEPSVPKIVEEQPKP
jgi:hypothetical protein